MQKFSSCSFLCCSLREYARSESERSFDEVQMRRARLQSLGLAYLSPQNKSLAQSFRYMRNKPTIIAFKTPSLENCEAQITAMALSVAQSSGSYSESLFFYSQSYHTAKPKLSTVLQIFLLGVILTRSLVEDSSLLYCKDLVRRKKY